MLLFIEIYIFLVFIFVFFFQAEDGIRDPLVTGVQTCALPISLRNFVLDGRAGISDAAAVPSDEHEVSESVLLKRFVDPTSKERLRRNVGDDLVQIGRASCRERV